MCYELYIDVLFLVNLFFDFLLLLTVKHIMRCPVSWKRIFIGSIAGSASTCLVIAIPGNNILKLILFHTVVNVMMIVIGLKIRKKEKIIKAILILYVTSILYGGILEIFSPYLHTEIIYFMIALLCAFFIRNIWMIFLREKRTQNTICTIILCEGKVKRKITALIDTGNTLTDPVSGEPVNIIGKELAKQIWEDKDQTEGIRYIPFCTIENKGIMPVFRVEKMCMTGNEDTWIKHPILGVCEGQISESKEYQMILNPDIIGGL